MKSPRAASTKTKPTFGMSCGCSNPKVSKDEPLVWKASRHGLIPRDQKIAVNAENRITIQVSINARIDIGAYSAMMRSVRSYEAWRTRKSKTTRNVRKTRLVIRDATARGRITVRTAD